MGIYAPATWDTISGDLVLCGAGAFRIVQLTTEGNSYGAARAAFLVDPSDPHFAIGVNAVYQHIDTDRVARALRHRRDTVETNRLSAIQIQVVGFAALPKETAALATVATLCRWIERIYGIPQLWPNGYPLGTNGNVVNGESREDTIQTSKYPAIRTGIRGIRLPRSQSLPSWDDDVRED
jgi:hypothetical protein